MPQRTPGIPRALAIVSLPCGSRAARQARQYFTPQTCSYDRPRKSPNPRNAERYYRQRSPGLSSERFSHFTNALGRAEISPHRSQAPAHGRGAGRNRAATKAPQTKSKVYFRNDPWASTVSDFPSRSAARLDRQPSAAIDGIPQMRGPRSRDNKQSRHPVVQSHKPAPASAAKGLVTLK